MFRTIVALVALGGLACDDGAAGSRAPDQGPPFMDAALPDMSPDALPPGASICRQPGVEKVLIDGRPTSRVQAGPLGDPLVTERWAYTDAGFAFRYERETPGETFVREFEFDEEGRPYGVQVTGDLSLSVEIRYPPGREVSSVYQGDAAPVAVITAFKDAEGRTERVAYDGTVDRRELLWAGVPNALGEFTGVDGALDRVERYIWSPGTLRREGDDGADGTVDDIDELDFQAGEPVTESRVDVDGDGTWDSTVTSAYADGLIVRQSLFFATLAGARRVVREMAYDDTGMTVTLTETSSEGEVSTETSRVECEPGRPAAADYFDLR